MSNSSPSCAMVGESCSPGPSGLCRWCGWYRCSMDCGRAVPELASRCSECHPLACPCEDCLAWEALPDTCGIPQEVEEDETSAQTVRLERDASIAETGAEWSEHLSKEAA